MINHKPISKKNIFKILKNLKKFNLKTEWQNLNQSNELIIAQDIISKINLPPFNNSAVDGYAILNNDIKKNKELFYNRRVAAGDNIKLKIKKGEAIRIFTGAKMPLNSNTVVMQENTKTNNNKVLIKKAPKIGSNCRIMGEDIKKNTIILKKGTKINTTNINLIAAIGIKKIKVYNKIIIGYFTSGNELKKTNNKIKGSEIYNSNYYSLKNLLNTNSIKSIYCGNLKDKEKIIEEKLKKNSKKFNLIITAGGASVGEEDHLINVINKIGNIIFWKAAIKPGRPIAIGKINNCYIVCLPGNPVSVQLLYALIVNPFINYLSGGDFLIPKPEKIKVNFKMTKKTKRMEWLRVLKKLQNTEYVAEKYPKQGSGMISSMAYADGIIEIPESVSKINVGDIYNYYDFKILFS